MNNRITTSLILILFFAVCISNLFVHKKLIDWNRNLQVILPEVRNSSFNFSSDFISNLDYNFPNLTQSALPIKAIIGAGLIRKDSTITEGLDLLYSSVSDNPYTGFPEAMLATYHQAMGNIDSLEYYTRKSHSILPNNPAHFILMSKMYVNQNKRDSILLLFEDIYKRVKKDPQVWKIFLAAVSSDANNLDTVKTKMYANEAKSLFKRTDMFFNDIDLLSDYVLYGQETVRESLRFQEEALQSFNLKDYGSAKANIINAIEIMPKKIEFYENLLMIDFFRDDYNSVVNLHKELERTNMVTLTLPSIEFITVSYINTGNLIQGCNFANLLIENNYSLSPSVIQVCQ